jgi:hypothetical protein
MKKEAKALPRLLKITLHESLLGGLGLLLASGFLFLIAAPAALPIEGACDSHVQTTSGSTYSVQCNTAGCTSSCQTIETQTSTPGVSHWYCFCPDEPLAPGRVCCRAALVVHEDEDGNILGTGIQLVGGCPEVVQGTCTPGQCALYSQTFGQVVSYSGICLGGE